MVAKVAFKFWRRVIQQAGVPACNSAVDLPAMLQEIVKRLPENDVQVWHLERVSYGASINTLNWLGTMRIPTAFVEFCRLTLVRRVAGVPFNSTVNAPVR